MERTTLMLPSGLKSRAQKRAQELGVSLGELVRQALDGALERGRPTTDPLLSDDATFAGTPADLAANHDDYLY